MTPESPRTRILHSSVNDRTSLNRIGRPHVVLLGRWPQPRCDEPAPSQVTKDYWDDDQGYHRDANKCDDEPGEEPSKEYTKKNACKKTEASPLEAPALESTHALASVHCDPRITRVRFLAPQCRIDCASEYCTGSRITFTFHPRVSSGT